MSRDKKEIIKEHLGDIINSFEGTVILDIHYCMDEYAKEMCLDLLEYMAKKEIECNYDNDRAEFARIGEGWVSKEELFQNFL